MLWCGGGNTETELLTELSQSRQFRIAIVRKFALHKLIHGERQQ